MLLSLRVLCPALIALYLCVATLFYNRMPYSLVDWIASCLSQDKSAPITVVPLPHAGKTNKQLPSVELVIHRYDESYDYWINDAVDILTGLGFRCACASGCASSIVAIVQRIPPPPPPQRLLETDISTRCGSNSS